MRYRLIYIVWLLPAYLLFIMIQQGLVYQNTIKTYNEGESIAADVLDFDIKQIAAQSNGYVVIEFIDPDGQRQERKLSLSVQMAQRIIDTGVIPIRYLEGSFQEIVMIPTFQLQKETSLSNLGIATIGFLILTGVSLLATRFARKRIKYGTEEFVIERVDV